MSYQSYEDLEVWKRAVEVAIRIYRELSTCRDFGLRDQMQRAAVSIASNIAEGSERGGNDFLRFLRVAKGSGAELRTQLMIASRTELLSPGSCQELNDELVVIGKMLTKLGQALQQKMDD